MKSYSTNNEIDLFSIIDNNAETFLVNGFVVVLDNLSTECYKNYLDNSCYIILRERIVLRLNVYITVQELIKKGIL